MLYVAIPSPDHCDLSSPNSFPSPTFLLLQVSKALTAGFPAKVGWSWESEQLWKPQKEHFTFPGGTKALTEGNPAAHPREENGNSDSLSVCLRLRSS